MPINIKVRAAFDAACAAERAYIAFQSKVIQAQKDFINFRIPRSEFEKVLDESIKLVDNWTEALVLYDKEERDARVEIETSSNSNEIAAITERINQS